MGAPVDVNQSIQVVFSNASSFLQFIEYVHAYSLPTERNKAKIENKLRFVDTTLNL